MKFLWTIFYIQKPWNKTKQWLVTHQPGSLKAGNKYVKEWWSELSSLLPIFYCQRRRENQCLVCQGKSLPSSGHISMFIMYLHSFLLVHTMQICDQARFNMFNSCQRGTFSVLSWKHSQQSFYQHKITIVWQFAGKLQLWKLHSSTFCSSAMILKFIRCDQ